MPLKYLSKLPGSASFAGLVFILCGFVPIAAHASALENPVVLAQPQAQDQQQQPPKTPEQQKQQPPAPATPNPLQTSPSAPLGTAVSPEVTPEGSPASNPTGAAIAPGKQKRIRRFSVRTALLLGGGVAVGIVTAASLASPSRPH